MASIGFTSDELGRMLYDSIHHKIMGLPDEVRVFPAHGAGSACGKNLSTEKQSTIGEQRRTNYACQPMTEDEFVAVVTEGQPTAPSYFVYNAVLNRQGRDTLEVDSSVPAMSPAEVAAVRRRCPHHLRAPVPRWPAQEHRTSVRARHTHDQGRARRPRRAHHRG